MSQDAALKFVHDMTWGGKRPDWYAQILKRYPEYRAGQMPELMPELNRELIRAAAENGYGEFTEQEYYEANKEVQEAVRRIR
jgi:hypothetical protein